MLRIDWMIVNDILAIEHRGDMPMLVFTDRGWIIERDQSAEQLLHQWQAWVDHGIAVMDMSYLKDLNRGLILLFLSKITATRDKRFIPLLEQWERVDYQKVRKSIRNVIAFLRKAKQGDILHLDDVPEEDVQEALAVEPRGPERLKCRICGKRFEWPVEEQDSFRMQGWEPPIRCPFCREKKHARRY